MVGLAALVTCVLWNRSPGVPRALWIRAVLVLATVSFRRLSWVYKQLRKNGLMCARCVIFME